MTAEQATESKRLRLWMILMQVVSGVVLAICPLIIIANVMGLTAGRRSGQPTTAGIGGAFMYGLLGYSVVYVFCVVAAWVAYRFNQNRAAFLLSLIPCVFLALLSALFVLLGWSDM